MKRLTSVLAAACVVAFVTSSVMAQPPGGEGRGRGGRGGADGRGGPRMHPLLMLFDEDKDGELSQAEIEGAVAKLKQLDKNGDGKLTADEMPRPQFAGGRGGQGGPGGERGGQGGPGGGRGGNFVEFLMRNDKDGDGKISKSELPERMQRMFERADSNGDGVIDRQEAEEIAKRMAEGRGQGSGRGGRGQRPSNN